MKASLQDRISPLEPARTANVDDFKKTEVNDPSAKPKVDFRSLILNSNKESEKKGGAADLSKAKNYEDFMNDLNQQTERARAPKTTMGKDEFLQLFVAQLQNQDPLNPKDGTDMASQLAQFNGLEQMLNVNKTLERMETAGQSDKQIQFVNYLDKEVSVDKGLIRLDGQQMSKAYLNLKSPINGALVDIKDGSGAVVYTKPLNGLVAGEHELAWDGLSSDGKKLGDGLYSVEVSQEDAQGVKTNLELSSKAKVKGLMFKEGKAQFETDLGPLQWDDIKSLSSSSKEGAGQALAPGGATVPPKEKKEEIDKAKKGIYN
ncbi:MAG: flagellar hook assembly protein FlgD [Oligoflexales bacterium]|nr:flagellar hook assembly protein FlgD [Oligoflexales bacterium]